MKKLVLVCLTVLTTISLLTSCGEKTATQNATPNATTEEVAETQVKEEPKSNYTLNTKKKGFDEDEFDELFQK